MKDEQLIEAVIQAKGLNAPRLNPQIIDEVIVGETFTILPSGKVMVCELTLANGYTVRGESATVSKDNFDHELGRTISRANARGKIWELEGYLLANKLYQQVLTQPEVKQLEQEIEYLRRYGNKDCTAMADEALAKARQPSQ